jgi:hypothetical protein
MNDVVLNKLRSVNKALTEPQMEKFTSYNGRLGFRLYNSSMGDFEIHICQSREDVEASNRGEW